MIVRPKPTGTLVHDALLPGERLWLLATGTGIAPFASLIRDPETYERFGQVILTHTCRDVAELAYGHDLVARTLDDPLVGEEARAEAHPLPHHHARALAAHGPHHRSAVFGKAARRSRPAAHGPEPPTGR